MLPATGVVFGSVAPDGRVVHELCNPPDAVLTATSDGHVLANGDQTRAFLFTGTPLPCGFGRLRLRLRWLRKSDADLPRLSVGGSTEPEDADLRYRRQ